MITVLTEQGEGNGVLSSGLPIYCCILVYVEVDYGHWPLGSQPACLAYYDVPLHSHRTVSALDCEHWGSVSWGTLDKLPWQPTVKDIQIIRIWLSVCKL